MIILFAFSLVYSFHLDFIPSTLKFPEKRWQSSMAHCGYSESIYVFSGVTENGLSTSFDMFNLTSNTWTSLYSYSYESPYLRSSAIMFQYQSHYIYLVGGLTDYGPINDIWRYSINLQLVFTI